jgi:hypothetical protein
MIFRRPDKAGCSRTFAGQGQCLLLLADAAEYNNAMVSAENRAKGQAQSQTAYLRGMGRIG